MALPHFFKTPAARWSAIGIGLLLFGLLCFHAGIAYGIRHDPFADHHRFGNDRHHIVPGGFGPSLSSSFIPNANGTVGTVTKVALPLVTLTTRDGASRAVTVGTSTVIRGNRSATSMLAAGDTVVVLGGLDAQGRLAARFIRILSATTTP